MNNIKQKVVSWLRWSEQYTKTDMVYLAKGGGWLAGFRTFSILSGLGLATAFANLVPQETYGTYKFLVSTAGIIGSFTLSGMGTAVKQAAAKGFDSALHQGAVEKFKWSIGIVIVGLSAAGYYYIQGNMELVYGMLMIAALYPFRSSSAVYEYFLEGKKDFRRKSLFNLSQETLQVSSMVVTLILTDNVLWVFFIFLITNTLVSLSFYFYTTQIYPQTSKIREAMSSYSKHLSVVEIFRKIIRHVDKVLVWHFLGPVQLAIYSFAELPISKLQTLAGSLWQTAFPKFSEKNMDTLRKTLDYKVFLLALVFLGTAGIYIVFAPFLFDILFPQYLQSVPFTQVYALGMVLFAGRVYENVLKAHAKTKWIYVSQIFGDIIKIIALIVLLPTFGVWGAIISLFAWELSRGILAYVGFKYSE